MRPALLFGGSLVRLAKLDSVAVVTIDHPPVNALGIAVLNALSQALRDAAEDPKFARW